MAGLIERWGQSGLSAAKFAASAGVPEARLWYWKRRVAASAPMPAFVPLQILPEGDRTDAATFELRFADGRTLVIPPSLAGRPLRQLLAALRTC